MSLRTPACTGPRNTRRILARDPMDLTSTTLDTLALGALCAKNPLELVKSASVA